MFRKKKEKKTFVYKVNKSHLPVSIYTCCRENIAKPDDTHGSFH